MDPIFDAFIADAPMPEIPNLGEGLRPGFADVLYLAYCADKERRWSDLEDLAGQALAIYPTSEFAMMLLGKGLVSQDRPAEAIAVLKRASAVNKGSQLTRFLYAEALRASGDAVGSVVVHKAILADWPDFGRSHYALGRIYASKKSWKSAILRFERAAECDPHRPNFRARIAQTKALAAEAGYIPE